MLKAGALERTCAFRDAMLKSIETSDREAYRTCLLRFAALARTVLADSFTDPGEREQALQRCLIRAHAKRATYTGELPFDAWAKLIIQRELENSRSGVTRPVALNENRLPSAAR